MGGGAVDDHFVQAREYCGQAHDDGPQPGRLGALVPQRCAEPCVAMLTGRRRGSHRIEALGPGIVRDKAAARGGGQGDPAAALQQRNRTRQRGLLGCIGRRPLEIKDADAGRLQGEFQRLLVKRKINGGLAVYVRTELADIMGLCSAGSQQQEKSSSC